MDDLDRFISAQKVHYDKALKDIKNGKKINHWMWFIFPQIIGLGKSATSIKYSIKNINEAKNYLENEYLRNNLENICIELLKLESSNPQEIFGYIDSIKLKSSMTLFDYVVNHFNMNTYNVFNLVLEKYYDGEKDELTLNIISNMRQKKIQF